MSKRFRPTRDSFWIALFGVLTGRIRRQFGRGELERFVSGTPRPS